MPDLKKKMGPLPIWAWGLIIGVGAYVVYRRMAGSSTATTSSTLDPNAIDPNTGLPYGVEEQAAEAPQGTAGSGVGDGSTTTPSNEFGDFLSFLDEWNQFAQSMGWTPPGTVPTTPADMSTPSSPTDPGGPATPTPSAPKVTKKKPAAAAPGKPKAEKPTTVKPPAPKIQIAGAKPNTAKAPAKSWQTVWAKPAKPKPKPPAKKKK